MFQTFWNQHYTEPLCSRSQYWQSPRLPQLFLHPGEQQYQRGKYIISAFTRVTKIQCYGHIMTIMTIMTVLWFILWLLSDRRLVYICPTIPKRGSGYSALSRVQPRRQRDHLLLHELLRGQLRPAQEPGPVSGQHGRRRGHRHIPD